MYRFLSTFWYTGLPLGHWSFICVVILYTPSHPQRSAPITRTLLHVAVRLSLWHVLSNNDMTITRTVNFPNSIVFIYLAPIPLPNDLIRNVCAFVNGCCYCLCLTVTCYYIHCVYIVASDLSPTSCLWHIFVIGYWLTLTLTEVNKVSCSIMRLGSRTLVMVFMKGLLIHRAFHTVAYNVCIKKKQW